MTLVHVTGRMAPRDSFESRTRDRTPVIVDLSINSTDGSPGTEYGLGGPTAVVAA
ncbi:hypothetical protein [Kitasatospora griseola]|uniref:hypothetical protein n=1 Tax=Kitasatospora griseola TaxID=2064 RepID=UPI003653703C